MKYLFLVIICLFTNGVVAQTDNFKEEEQAVINTIKALFDGMRASDTIALRTALHPAAHLQSSFTNKEGKPVLREGSIDRWVASIGKPHEEIYDEKIWSYEVRIDDNLAAVWTEYTFFVGPKLSHCGVNAFHLVKTEEGWKISHITDTRRRTNCKEE